MGLVNDGGLRRLDRPGQLFFPRRGGDPDQFRPLAPRRAGADAVMTGPGVRFMRLAPGEDRQVVEDAIRRVVDRGWYVLGPVTRSTWLPESPSRMICQTD